MSEEPGFLARWSRRKRGLTAPQRPAAPAPASAAPVAVVAPEPPAPIDPAQLAGIETMSDLEALRDLLGPQVAPWLRQAALRRIWVLDPAIRDFVGPADYAWDFNAPDGVPGFAAGLGGEVGRLLAQAIGSVEAPQPPADEADAPGPATVVAAEPAALPGSAPAEPEAAAALPVIPPRPRHGGARPV